MKLCSGCRFRDVGQRAGTYGHQGLADGGEHVGPQRVQQQLLFSQRGQQQHAGVLRAQVLQQLQETGTAATTQKTKRL